MKENVIDAALKELGESTIIDCDMPTGLKVIDHTSCDRSYVVWHCVEMHSFRPILIVLNVIRLEK